MGRISNQHTPDARQQKCWENYLDSIQRGIPNATKAAIDAGYEPKSAKDITSAVWWLERLEGLRRKRLLSKSEKKFEEIMDMDSMNGGIRIDSKLLAVQANVGRHITSTLGRDVGYATRQEHTGANGEKLIPGEMTPELKALAQEYERKLKEQITK